mmetsp:Transcript_30692/g.59159  ORF Transcript_30692/g.59159 Transcript_30692/m.59159 type:complete len:91 (+) Transcript_30692:292-564(+)
MGGQQRHWQGCARQTCAMMLDTRTMTKTKKGPCELPDLPLPAATPQVTTNVRAWSRQPSITSEKWLPLLLFHQPASARHGLTNGDIGAAA